MAVFRKVHTLIWSDPFFSELESKKKLFFIYLLTNERTKQCGIYEISKRQISFDLGYSIDTVSNLLEYFTKKGKIKFSDNTNEIALKNWDKYNKSTSPKVKMCIENELKEVKDRVLIEYIYSIDTASQEEEEKEEEKEQNNIQARKAHFYKSLEAFLNEYSKDTLRDFFDYWSEHGENDKKMKFEKEKSFSIKARLKRWAKNDFNKTEKKETFSNNAHLFMS
jgi:hypothetical protein